MTVSVTERERRIISKESRATGLVMLSLAHELAEPIDKAQSLVKELDSFLSQFPFFKKAREGNTEFAYYHAATMQFFMGPSLCCHTYDDSIRKFAMMILQQTTECMIRNLAFHHDRTTLQEALKKCRNLIYPEVFPPYRPNPDLDLSFGYISHVCSKEEYDELFSALLFAADERLYCAYWKNSKAQMKKVKNIRKHQEGIWRILSKLLHSEMQKQAKHTFMMATNDIVIHIMQNMPTFHPNRGLLVHAPHKDFKKPTLSNDQYQRTSKSHNNDYADSLKKILIKYDYDDDITFDQIESITDEYIDKMIEIIQKFEHDLTNLDTAKDTPFYLLKLFDKTNLLYFYWAGYYLSMIENSIWAYSFIPATMFARLQYGAGMPRSINFCALRDVKEDEGGMNIHPLERIGDVAMTNQERVEEVTMALELTKQLFESLTFTSLTAPMGISLVSPKLYESQFMKESLEEKLIHFIVENEPEPNAEFFPKEAVPYTLFTILQLQKLGFLQCPDLSEQESMEDLKEKYETSASEQKQLKQDVAHLQEQNKRKDKIIQDLLQEKELAERKELAKEKELVETKEQKRIMKEEYDALLDMMKELMQEENQSEEKELEVQYPVSFSGLKVVSFGGMPAFNQAMQPLFPEMIIKDPANRPDPMMLRSADVVFLQIATLSHSNYYAVMDICRNHKIPVVSYRYTGAKSCANQVVQYIEQKHPGHIISV